MKRPLTWAIRILGVALVGFIIYQIDYVDRYVTAEGETVKGRIVERRLSELVFRTEEGEERTIPLSKLRYRLRVVEEDDRLGTPVALELTGPDGGRGTGVPFAVGPKDLAWDPGGGVAAREGARADWTTGSVTFRDEEGSEHVVELDRILDLQPEIHEGLFTIGSRLNWPLAVGSSLLFFCLSWTGVWRWRFLMATQGLRITMLESFRLTYIGFFFNNVVPGLTGGDIVKAYYIAKRSPGARANAAVSVFVDRIIGIVGLATLGGAVLLFKLDEPAFRAAAIVLYVFLACVAAGGVAFFSRRVRRWLRIDRLLAALPGAVGRVFQKVDKAFFAYRDHRGALLVAFLLSLVNHASLIVMNIGFAWALGIRDVPVTAFFVLIPVIMMISSIPLLPGGWGIGEFAYATFLGFVDVPFTQAIALSFVFRISNLLWSLLGGIFFVTGRDRVTSEQLEEEAKLEDEAMGMTD